MSNFRPYSNAGQGTGYMQDSFGADSAAPMKRANNHSLRPVTIKQLLSVGQTQSDGDMTLDGRDLGQVVFIAVVRLISAQSTHTTYTVEDGTGQIELKKFASDDEDAVEQSSIIQGSYVKVVGNLKEFQQRFSITVHVIRPIQDMNELTYHNLEVMLVHASLTRSKIGSGTGSNVGVGGLVGMAGMVGTSVPGNMYGKSIDDQISEYVGNHPEGKTNGVHRRDITSKFAAQMGGAPAVETKLRQLIEDGFMFSAGDDDHLMVAQ
ncbi:replication factor A2 [Entomortierella parvispora]|uniref:Replication factor A2 n=1 Tax=Entomortierella parvispora TaxID=205924 RepID=A0A9P3H9Y9_9FUNG|nr:replication factor A2 [Entomortierella parvispora]